MHKSLPPCQSEAIDQSLSNVFVLGLGNHIKSDLIGSRKPIKSDLIGSRKPIKSDLIGSRVNGLMDATGSALLYPNPGLEDNLSGGSTTSLTKYGDGTIMGKRTIKIPGRDGGPVGPSFLACSRRELDLNSVGNENSSRA
ncbi:hypothetical protein Btru_056066 [Bulinus truncatus]|nr:hypothetical protein Btru_056066 [Bulinus truncatus]